MATCIFENEKEQKYKCTYDFIDGKIKVKVFKDLYSDEYKGLGIVNLSCQNEEEYKEKIINIFDADNKIYLKLFHCYISGYNTMYGSFDGYESVTYATSYYIQGKSEDDIYNINDNPRIDAIRIYHPTIQYIYGNPSFELRKSEDEVNIKLKKNIKKDEIIIDSNNIKSVSISDDWSCQINNKLMSIKLTGYAELTLKRKIKLSDSISYIKEFQIYMELLKQKCNLLEKVYLKIKDKYFELKCDEFYSEKENKNIQLSFKDNIDDYLKNCYKNMQIRGNNSVNRNIPYILFGHSRNIEDSYLLYYRFIECFYKKKNYQSNFIFKALNDSKNIYLRNFKEEDIENVVQEIVCLRNQYVHSGYHIKGGNLKVKSKDEKINYNVKVDFDWIYKRTKLLYYIVIDIIYKQILKIDKYNYNKHF